MAGRETVADRGLFITKKRYAVNAIDIEGKRYDVNGKSGKTKATGLDLKRSDTPKVIQEFLLEILNKLLAGAQRDELIEHIRKFKYEFKERPAWEKGSPKRVNNLTKYGAAEVEHGHGLVAPVIVVNQGAGRRDGGIGPARVGCPVEDGGIAVEGDGEAHQGDAALSVVAGGRALVGIGVGGGGLAQRGGAGK